MDYPQIETLKFVGRFISENGWAPSLREVVSGTSASSTSVARYRLERLDLLGYIYREPWKVRTIRLTERGRKFLEERRGDAMGDGGDEASGRHDGNTRDSAFTNGSHLRIQHIPGTVGEG